MRMASASLARRKSLTAQQALARLHEMDAADSDGGEQPTDASSDESEMETEQEPNTPPRRMRRGTGKPSPSQTAKGGASANRSRFTARAGPTESAKRKITSVLQSFLCLLDMGMLLTITECTVHQARRTELDWKLASDELMAFISILFVRAIMCPVGAIADCWSENFLVPVIKETMSRDRFLSIMQHLRFDDKDTRAERVKTDRFAAISDIWTRFTKNCAESFTPGEHMTIDEQLFPTKVRCPFTQYIASKPEKIGIKFWMVTDLETKYVCNVSPYLGKAPGRQKGERQAENVVMSLMEPFLGDGRSVTTDNFFISLSHRLLQRNTTLLGTVNKVRSELPSSAKDTAEREEFSMSVFRMARMYSVRAATRRWPVAVFYNMLDLAAVNAYILYKVCTGWKGKRRLFLSLLAKELRCQFMQQKAIERERNAAAAAAAFAAVPGRVQTTQCQVQESCNRNRSRFTCVKCHKFTCAKCRDDGHWVCKRCKHRLKQTDKLCGRVTAPKTKRREEEKNNFRVKLAIKALVTKGTLVQTKGTGASGSFKLNKKQSEAVKKPAKKAAPKAKKPAAKKPAAAKKPKKAAASAAKRPAAAKKSPKKAKKPAVAKKAAKSPKKAKKPAAAKKATKSPKKAKAAKPKVAKPKATKAKKAAPKKK